jgi:AcrR family transcriptional regulator
VPRSAIAPRLPADQRRAQILREAARLFGTHGFNGTTTRDVAARVGLTEAALYRYYPSKEAMYVAILDERMAVTDPLARVLPKAAARDDHGVFAGLALELLRSVEADPSILRLLLYSALEGHQLARRYHDRRIRQLRDFLTRYVARRVRDRAFRKLSPALAARAFMGMVVNQLIVRHVFGQEERGSETLEKTADTFAAIFLDGMRAPGAGPSSGGAPSRNGVQPRDAGRTRDGARKLRAAPARGSTPRAPGSRHG